MNSYAQPQQNPMEKADLSSKRRQEKALRGFKEVLADLVLMLQEGLGMETAYLYWINRSRHQFVMEAHATRLRDAVFQDRVAFSDHFLEAYKDIDKPQVLHVGDHLPRKAFTHYSEELPVEYVTLLPFVHNDETVAITVLEGNHKKQTAAQREVLYAYNNALANVLTTYLEVNDLNEAQKEWVHYEESLSFLKRPGHYAGLISDMLKTLQGYLQEGGVSFIVNGMGIWTNGLNSAATYKPVPLGMPMEKHTVAWEALRQGNPEFTIHFNNSPKRLSPRELHTDGATLAIPFVFSEHRKGLVLIYDKNPLLFKESVKHKLVNSVRLTALTIQSRLHNKDWETPLLVNAHAAFIPDLWERAVDQEIQCLRAGKGTYHTWVGLITLSELAEIRTQLRLEELNEMQKDLIHVFNPAQVGIPGFVGFYTDYTYMVLLQDKDPEAVNHWKQQLNEKFKDSVELRNGKFIKTGLKIGYTMLDGSEEDSYQVMNRIKKEYL